MVFPCDFKYNRFKHIEYLTLDLNQPGSLLKLEPLNQTPVSNGLDTLTFEITWANRMRSDANLSQKGLKSAETQV